MITFVATGLAFFLTIIMMLYTKDRNPWKTLIAYSSIMQKVAVLMIFLDGFFSINFLSELVLVFLLMNTGGTIIAAYFLGVRE
ncbi:MAG: hypothetical protein U9O65_04510 [Thermotogota bacterium]|nr:hypothetical protein [Thermotogota bacterium]